MANNTFLSPFAKALGDAAGAQDAVLTQEAGGSLGQGDTFEQGVKLLQSLGNSDDAAFGEGGLPPGQQELQEKIAKQRNSFAEARRADVQNVFDASKIDAEEKTRAELNAKRAQIQALADQKKGHASADIIGDQVLVEIKTVGQGTQGYIDHLARSLQLVVAQINSAAVWAQQAADKRARQEGKESAAEALNRGNLRKGLSGETNAHQGQ